MQHLFSSDGVYFASLSEAAAYKAAGIEEYEILVTLDERTCNICGPLDGRVEKVADMEPGVNAPPFHPNCRCTTIGHYDDDIDDTRIARDENGKNIWVDGDMTWEEWREQYENRVTAEENDDKMSARNFAGRHMSNGHRKSRFHVLTEEEKASVIKDAESIGVPLDILRFNKGSRTGYSERMGAINVRGDLLPDFSSNNNRDRMSQKCVLAHEYYGHYMAHPSEFPRDDWRDEFRASYRAALVTPRLSEEERRMLMIDAYERAKEAGVSVTYNETARRIIHGTGA